MFDLSFTTQGKKAARAQVKNQFKFTPDKKSKEVENLKTVTLYVGNLNYRKDEAAIKKLFTNFGKVKSVKIVYKEGTELKTGIAFVEMFKQEHAEMAITELNGKVIDDRTLKVSIANSRF
jgi:RNA recognition motif-containing protein